MYLFFQQNYNFVHEVANFRQLKQVGVFFFFSWQISALWRRQKKKRKRSSVRRQVWFKGFLVEKMCQSHQILRKRILKSPYLIETMWGVLGSSRSPKYRRILNDFFDSSVVCYPNLANSSCGWLLSSVAKHHKIKKRKKKPGTEFISRSPKFDQP